MGMWHISIQGTGIHHNSATETKDAEKMAAKFVEELRAAGHQVEHATITYGARQNV